MKTLKFHQLNDTQKIKAIEVVGIKECQMYDYTFFGNTLIMFSRNA